MRVFIGIGSNLGNRRANLGAALKKIEEKCKILQRSSIYETEPKYYTDQPKFLNMVIEVKTDMDPYEILGFLQLDEEHLGRNRPTELKHGPRVIDLDILYYKGLEIETEKLSIPHPKMTERAFVMIPLAEIAPELMIRGLTAQEIVDKIPKEEKGTVKRIRGTRPKIDFPAKPLNEGHKMGSSP